MKYLFFFTLLLLSQSITASDNYALKFDGIDDYVMILDDESLDLTTGITIEVWIKVDSVSPRHMHFISKNEGYGSSDKAYALNTDGDLRPYIFLGQICTPWTNSPALKANTWTHIAGTFDGSFRRFYLNGELQYEVSCSPGSQLYENDLPLLLGRLNNFAQYLKGEMDEARVWRVARSQEEIQEFMYNELPSSEITNPDLVGYWTFNEGSGVIVNDQSIYENDGGFVNSPIWVESTAPFTQNNNGFYVEMNSLPRNRSWIEAYPYNDAIYCFVGTNGPDLPDTEREIWKYNFVNDNWSVYDTTSFYGIAVYSCIIGDVVFFAGGQKETSWITDSVFCYDIETKHTDTLACLPTALTTGKAFNDNGKFHILGGHNGGGPVNPNYIYNPSTDTWSSGPSLPGGLHHNGIIKIDTIVYLIGGRGLGGFPASNINLIYNTKTEEFSYGQTYQ